MQRPKGLGNILKGYRERRTDLTQKGMAQELRAGWERMRREQLVKCDPFPASEATVQRTEQGQRVPTFLEILVICDILGISLAELHRDVEDLRREPSMDPGSTSTSKEELEDADPLAQLRQQLEDHQAGRNPGPVAIRIPAGALLILDRSDKNSE